MAILFRRGQRQNPFDIRFTDPTIDSDQFQTRLNQRHRGKPNLGSRVSYRHIPSVISHDWMCNAVVFNPCIHKFCRAIAKESYNNEPSILILFIPTYQAGCLSVAAASPIGGGDQ